jgi:ribonuclease BN (tRNA processing enzyme)
VEVRLLGSGGFVPTDRRETACALIRSGSEALCIDAGTGARRLLTEPALLDGIERLHVVLTHFHLDHTLGLFFLPALEPAVEVWAAGQALEQTSNSELMSRLLSPPFAPRSFVSRFAAVHELGIGAARVGPFDVLTRVQTRHANPTLALRFTDDLVWCTDTAYDEENADFARGARLLCHEAFHAAERTDDAGHTASGEAARLAVDAGVDRLLLIHVNPERDDEDALLGYARAAFEATEVARDGLVVRSS